MIRYFVCIIFVFSAAIDAEPAKGWFTYERCELVEDKFFDGDSFSVKVLTGHTYIFRLYGVDCPETDDRAFMKERIEQQLKAFELKKERKVIKWGKKATEFTKKFLRKPFTVYTQKADAGGASENVRYYSIVVNSKGERLDEALIKAGLARVYGFYPEWDEPFWAKGKIDLPRKSDKDDFERRLKRLQTKAKRAKVGVWGGK